MTTTIDELRSQLAQAEAREMQAKAAVQALRTEKTWYERNNQRIQSRAFELALEQWDDRARIALHEILARAADQIRDEATKRTEPAREAKIAKHSDAEQSHDDNPNQ